MITISGYQITEQLYESSNSFVFRGVRNADSLPAVLKVLRKEYPAPDDLGRFRREYQMTRKLKSDGVIRAYSLEKHRNSLAIVLEDIGGESAERILCSGRPELSEVLRFAVRVTEILGLIHRENIMHKDINPSNIVWNRKNDQIRIIDFGISAELPREIPEISSPGVMEGTLPYMSPEQTGRMNRAVDYRTDMYSLGVTLYEVLTGKLPFLSRDPAELVYCHIAVTPTQPREVNPEIPRTVSDIVMKLLSKNAEQRYRSAFGLKADLLRCLDQLRSGNSVEPFEIGHRDISRRFQIPQKLYGREQDTAALMDAFGRAGRGAKEIMLVAGHPGIGKSVLVQEIHKPVIRKQGYFISGKFGQFKRDIPYDSLIRAFRELIRQLLTESREQAALRKEQLLKALGTGGRVITDVIPELELLIGRQPAVPDMPSAESENRFNRMFQNFIYALAREKHPLAVFLDDLQWADPPTLKLIRLLMTDQDGKHILLVGAYRDNETGPGHPLMLMLDELRKDGASVSTVTLNPLETHHAGQLVSETLACDPHRSRPLTDLCLEKTGGNPFFLRQFLRSLYEKRYIGFDADLGFWKWDTERIRQARMTDNVIELMAGRIRELPGKTIRILKTGACIGDRFDLETLSAVNKKSPAAVAADLWESLRDGLVIPDGASYKFVHDSDRNPDVSYRFLHDRVQEAVYSLLSEKERIRIHYDIGKALLSQKPGETEDALFEIVQQLNHAVSLISSREERTQLAGLNLKAGLKAKKSAAFEPARNYFRQGLQLLPHDSWESEYDMTLSLYTESGEAAYLTGNHEESDDFFDEVLEKAESPLDKIKVYEIRMVIFTVSNKHRKAVEMGIELLNRLGAEMPLEADNQVIEKERAEFKLNMEGREAEDLISLPELTDPHKLAVSRILISCFAPCFIGVPGYVPIVVLKAVNLSLKYGNSGYAAFAYTTYGLLLCSAMGDIEQGYRFGKLALCVLEKYNAGELKNKIYHIFGDMVCHWKKPLREGIKYILDGYRSGIESGDLQFASYSLNHYLYYSFFAGETLDDIKGKYEKYYKVMKKLGQPDTITAYELWYQVVVNLKGKAEDRLIIKGELFDENRVMPEWIRDNTFGSIGIHTVGKLLYLCFHGAFEHAVAHAEKTEKYLIGVRGMFFVPEFYFCYSLALLSYYPHVSKKEQKQYTEQVKANQEKMKIWTAHAPENFKHKYLLVEAEISRFEGKFEETVRLYDKAVELARQNRFMQDEAMANELAGRFCLSRNMEKFAASYLREARYGYELWGACGKVRELDEKYPRILAETPAGSRTADIGSESFHTITGLGTGAYLDLATVIKASQAVSGEIRPDRLTAKLMRILMENAGAQRACLILEKDGELLITAEASADSVMVPVSQPVPVKIAAWVSQAVISYVARTQTPVVLNDASNEGQFMNDPYIIANSPKSLLCAPLVNRGKLIGMFYLENSLAAGAFTPGRVEVLRIISSQAAISVENARIYQELDDLNRHLEQKVEDRTRELAESSKMAALGQLIAGVAHEINNPLGAIRSSVENISEILDRTLMSLPVFFRSLPEDHHSSFLNLLERALRKDMNISLKEVRKHRRTLAHVLKEHIPDDADTFADILADMGVYDSIEEFLPLLEDRQAASVLQTAYSLSGLQRNAQTIGEAADRTSKVVFALKNYAHFDSSGEPVRADITEGIETVLTLYSSHLKPGVEVMRNYEEIQMVLCYPDELNQVWTNLVHNALQAMDSKGTLTIDVSLKNDQAVVAFTDSGKGIPEDIKDKIFAPFFTTKPQGEGTGLGLDIVRKIIDKHNGAIEVESEPGRTTFSMSLPVND